MTIALLQSALVERTRAALVDLWGLETPVEGSERRPRVAAGWPPPPRDPKEGETQADVEVFPYALIRPVFGDDGEEQPTPEAIATMAIVIGTYSDTDEGHTDVINAIDVIRNNLEANPILTATSQREGGEPQPIPGVLKSLTWDLFPEQPRPQWGGFVTTIWTIERPTRVDGA